MKVPVAAPRVVAVVIRTSRFGYAVFDGPKRLLDFGAGEIVSHDTGNAVGTKRLTFIFRHFSPAVVAIRRSSPHRALHKSRGEGLLRFLKEEASTRGIAIVPVNQEMVEHAFGIFRARTKQEMAEALTVIFPELLWKLPPHRKSWQPEPHVLIVFDAIAAGFAYWQEYGSAVPPPQKNPPDQ